MTNPTPHGQVPEALIDLIDAYAETRHRCGGIYNARTEAARNAVIEALSGVQALSAAPAGWKLVPVEPTDEMLKAADDGDDEYTLRNFGPGVQRVMQGPYDHYCAMLAASPTPPAEQQATSETAPGVGNSGFDHQTAAAFLSGKTVSDEAVRKFVQASSWAHDEKAALSAMLLSVRGVLASREAEIALLKKALMEAEAAPQSAASHGQAPAPTHEQIAAYLESTGAYVTNDATREAAIAEAIDTDRAKRGQAPDLHPKTSDLVQRFAAALAEKLSAAEKKYGYSDGWASPNWMDECRQHLSAHIAKGDPRDVAAYCAFLWHHGATTASPQAEQQAPTGSEIYVCARKCYNCGHAGINDDHADNAACKSCDWSGPSPEKDHCPDCEKDGTMTAACPMCSCAYIMVADTQVAAPAALNAPQAAPQQEAQDATVAAFEAVRKKLCTLPRYSFVLDDDGLVRRAPDRTGNWIEFDEAHALFDPVSVDAAIAAQGGK